MPKTIEHYTFDKRFLSGSYFPDDECTAQAFYPSRGLQLGLVSLKQNSIARYGLHRKKHRQGLRHTSSHRLTQDERFIVVNSGQIRSSIEQRFDELKQKWKIETSLESSLTVITANKHYLRIIGLGPSAIHLILKELQKTPAPWFVALQALTGEYNIGKRHAGRFGKIAAEGLSGGKSEECYNMRLSIGEGG